ncbi:MAG: pyridoxamine 5'-phosphate oxidase family protein [Candidatus Heimdallarchaeota archaeon]|nr:pyridoxamine 5'-phosphate oxidase family protein [Candidatus Heimdallarchaeota archaeon]
MKRSLKISKPVRPFIPGYGISEEDEGMATWSTVNEWMNESKNYWVSTTRPDFKPHTRPIWGIWLDEFFYFGGGSNTKTVRNLLENENVTVHTESGDRAVIIEGVVEKFEDDELNQILGSKYDTKYGTFHPPPFWRVIPRIVYCWNMKDYTTSPTKFRCTLK